MREYENETLTKISRNIFFLLKQYININAAKIGISLAYTLKVLCHELELEI